MKLTILVGHNEQSKGMTTYDNRLEYDFNLKVAQGLSELLNVRYFTRPSLKTYDQQIDAIIPSLLLEKTEICLELHLNAISSHAIGAEILTHYLQKGEKFKVLEEFLKDYCLQTGARNRTVKKVPTMGRGYYFTDVCYKNNIIPMIWEPCFANWRYKDSIFVLENTEEYVKLLACLCKKHFIENTLV